MAVRQSLINLDKLQNPVTRFVTCNFLSNFACHRVRHGSAEEKTPGDCLGSIDEWLVVKCFIRRYGAIGTEVGADSVPAMPL